MWRWIGVEKAPTHDLQDFDEILELIQNDITKTNTNMCDSIPENIKLVTKILFLAKGDNYTNLQYQFWVHSSTLSKFIPSVCDAIYIKLRDEYLGVSIFVFYNLQKNKLS